MEGVRVGVTIAMSSRAPLDSKMTSFDPCLLLECFYKVRYYCYQCNQLVPVSLEVAHLQSAELLFQILD